MAIHLSLITAALLVVAFIVGSEICLPSARIALRTGSLQLWKTACHLVALGEWAMIAIGLSFLLLTDHLWHLFTGPWPVKLAGLLAKSLEIPSERLIVEGVGAIIGTRMLTIGIGDT